VKHILVIHTAFPGDLVLATPLLESLKASDVDSRIVLLTIPSNSVLFENNPFVDEVIPYDKRGTERGVLSFIGKVRALRARGFDTAVIPHPSLRSALLALLGGIRTRIGFSHRWCSFLYTDRVDAGGSDHEVARNLLLAEAAGGGGDVSGPTLYPRERHQETVRRLLRRSGIPPGAPYIAVAPGSVWPTKRWPLEKFRGLVARLTGSCSVVLVGGEEDRGLCGEILETETGSPRMPVTSAAGELDLLESAALIAGARLLVSGDSAPVHLAAAVGTAVVAIFGPTVPAFGFAPWGVPHLIVEKDLPCRPCSDHGPERCPLGHFRCMRDISEEEVMRAVVELLEMTGKDGGEHDVLIPQ
jgi:heptosyltransferase-2